MKILVWDSFRNGWVKHNGLIESVYIYAQSFDTIQGAKNFAHSMGIQSYELFILVK